jgi:hypothetical protein
MFKAHASRWTISKPVRTKWQQDGTPATPVMLARCWMVGYKGWMMPEEVAEFAWLSASDISDATTQHRYRFAVSVCGGFYMH